MVVGKFELFGFRRTGLGVLALSFHGCVTQVLSKDTSRPQSFRLSTVVTEAMAPLSE